MTDSPFAPGNTIHERYQLEGLIGQGGMGAVYLVRDTRLPGRQCALKAMRIPMAELPGAEPGTLPRASDAARQQFLTEASTLARLDHPNLPKVSDYFTLDAYDCLVMDYVPGQDLQQRIQHARREGRFLAEEQVVAWIDQLCDVLLYLHGRQPPIVHGDVKPANVKLTADGRIKLVDFGLARPSDPEDPRTLSGTGLRGLGSLPYAALEQYAGNARSDPRSDLYSLGATLYHLATNQAPAGAHERFLDPDALPSPHQINPGISPALEQAILAALQIHPKQRPASVAAWRRLLPVSDNGAPAQTDPSTVEAPRGSMTGVWAGNRWYVLAALLLFAAAVAVTFVR